MKARPIQTRADFLQAVQDFESALRRMAKADALAEIHAGSAIGRICAASGAREETNAGRIRAALITFAHTLPD